LRELEDAFMIHAAHRFDAKGRKYIGTPIKYYFEDVGLRNARIGFMHWGASGEVDIELVNDIGFRKYEICIVYRDDTQVPETIAF
jgi:ATPase